VQTLDEPLLVAAPCDVHRPDLTAARAECRGADTEHVGRIHTRLAAPDLSGVQAVPDVAALRTALTTPLAGEVQDVGGPSGHGHHRDQSGEVVRSARTMRAFGSSGRLKLHQTGRGQPDRQVKSQLGHVVHEVNIDPPATAVESIDGCRDRSRSRSRGRTCAVAGDRRDARPSLELGWQQGEFARLIGRVVQLGRPARRAQRLFGGFGKRSQVGSPVQDDRHRWTEIDDEGHAGGAEVDDAVTGEQQGVSSRRRIT